MTSQFSNFAKQITTFWRDYGGVRALVGSPLAWLALGITGLSLGLWSKENWWDLPLSVLPNLLGFTLGGLAVFMAFSDQTLLEVATSYPDEPEGSVSPYVGYANTYLHFIFVQILALLCALVFKGVYMLPPLGWFIEINASVSVALWAMGFFLFAYALTSAAGSALSLYFLAKQFDSIKRMQKAQDAANSNQHPGC